MPVRRCLLTAKPADETAQWRTITDFADLSSKLASGGGQGIPNSMLSAYPPFIGLLQAVHK